MHKICALVVMLLLAGAPVYADISQGEAAFERGDYEAALGEFRPLAAAGDARAQYYLGLIYYHGEGVKQDYAEAADWFHKAAQQGSVQFVGIIPLQSKSLNERLVLLAR